MSKETKINTQGGATVAGAPMPPPQAATTAQQWEKSIDIGEGIGRGLGLLSSAKKLRRSAAARREVKP